MTCEHDALRITCPTCGGTRLRGRVGLDAVWSCPDCTDGRMSHERAYEMLASYIRGER